VEVGAKVICRGMFAKDFSLAGTVEVVLSKGAIGGPNEVYGYGVRLVNGNYRVFPKEDVKKD
jgi:hypothetical protein